jgi:hypothetical protein
MESALSTPAIGSKGAAQVMTRRMIARGVSAPKTGNASTGWKRLLTWKAELQDDSRPSEAMNEYRSFAAQIEKISPQERVERVLEASCDARPVHTFGSGADMPEPKCDVGFVQKADPPDSIAVVLQSGS